MVIKFVAPVRSMKAKYWRRPFARANLSWRPSADVPSPNPKRRKQNRHLTKVDAKPTRSQPLKDILPPKALLTWAMQASSSLVDAASRTIRPCSHPQAWTKNKPNSGVAQQGFALVTELAKCLAAQSAPRVLPWMEAISPTHIRLGKRESRHAGSVYRLWHLWRDPASGRNAECQSDRRHQQGFRCADLQAGALRCGR